MGKKKQDAEKEDTGKEDDNSKPSTSESFKKREKRRFRPHRSRYRHGSPDPEEDDGSKPRSTCRFCRKDVSHKTMKVMKVWWEVLLVLMATIHDGKLKAEEARKEYAYWIKYNTTKKYKSDASDFFMCWKHVIHVAKIILDKYGVHNPSRIKKISESKLKNAVELLSSFNTSACIADRNASKNEKIVITGASFIGMLEQFTGYDWDGLRELYPHLDLDLRERANRSGTTQRKFKQDLEQESDQDSEQHPNERALRVKSKRGLAANAEPVSLSKAKPAQKSNARQKVSNEINHRKSESNEESDEEENDQDESGDQEYDDEESEEEENDEEEEESEKNEDEAIEEEIARQPNKSVPKGIKKKEGTIERITKNTEDTFNEIFIRTFEKQDSSSPESTRPSSSAVSKTLTSSKRNEHRQCKICERRVGGTDLSGDWSKRFVLHRSLQCGEINEEECSHILQTSNRLFICHEHAGGTAAHLGELFGSSNHSEFADNYQTNPVRQNVDLVMAEICGLFGLGIESQVFVKQARHFVYTHGKDLHPDIFSPSQIPTREGTPDSPSPLSQETSDRRRSHAATSLSSQPDSSVKKRRRMDSERDRSRKSPSPEEDISTTKSKTRKCHICDESIPSEILVCLQNMFHILCLLALLHLQRNWTIQRVNNLYRNKITLRSGPRFIVCKRHCTLAIQDLCDYLRIRDIEHINDANYDQTNPLIQLMKRIEPTVSVPADFLRLRNKLVAFVTLCDRRS